MKLFLPKYPAILKLLYPERLSKADNKETIFLTFDDGPIPEVTPWVLEELEKVNAIATFFCIGDNVNKHPEIFQRIIQSGHSIGNHTFNHLNGWKTSTSEYTANVYQAEIAFASIMQEEGEKKPNSELQTPSYKLFRPPYGKIKNSQARAITKQGYQIVMWDVISGDYDIGFSAEKCFENITKNSSAGSIIVLHDSRKAYKNLKILLPKLLKYYSEKGLEFRSLKDAL